MCINRRTHTTCSRYILIFEINEAFFLPNALTLSNKNRVTKIKYIKLGLVDLLQYYNPNIDRKTLSRKKIIKINKRLNIF